MDKAKIRQIIVDQQVDFKKKDNFVERDININYYLKGNEIVIITGIRRCGKSTLLKLISQQIEGIKVFINFDDIRFVDFQIDNFQDIQDIIEELYGSNKKLTLFLDEIQNISNWERWVNNLYSKKIKVFLTGSNSSLLSSEISTYLTGRNKVIKLFPFSFKEYLELKKIPEKKLNDLTQKEKTLYYKHFLNYFFKGGFPLVLKNNDLELSRQYFTDILNKDILNRYKIRESKELKDLILFLFSNVGRIYSYSTLKQVSQIKSLSTIKNFIDYFQNVFLLHSVSRFDYSIKKQKISSSKIYSLDNSFLKTVAFNFSENRGRRLENLVLIQLLRKNNEIYYHLDKYECDFLIKEKLKICSAIQVSLHLNNPLTKKREINGLLDAMKNYNLKTGLILTLEEEEIIKIKNKKIIVKPVWKWLLENY